MIWEFKVDMNFKGNKWQVSLNASEEGILTMLRSAYTNLLEPQLKELPGSTLSGSQIQTSLFNDALVLLRCLVLNRLEVHSGQHVKIKPTRE